MILYLTPEAFRIAVEVRQCRAILFADSLIAATALEHDECLATHNTDDFTWIQGLDLLDPLRPRP